MPGNSMGIVYTDLRLGNFARPDLEEITVNAVADTGAIELVIPEHVPIQLQLSELRPRELRLADGTRKLVRYGAPVKIQMMGRDCVTGAIIMGDAVLLGAVSDGAHGPRRRSTNGTRRAESGQSERPRLRRLSRFA